MFTAIMKYETLIKICVIKTRKATMPRVYYKSGGTFFFNGQILNFISNNHLSIGP